MQRYLGIRDDGIFGPVTEREVRRYQRQQDLVFDGIVGPNTWARIEAGLRGEKPGGLSGRRLSGAAEATPSASCNST